MNADQIKIRGVRPVSDMLSDLIRVHPRKSAANLSYRAAIRARSALVQSQSVFTSSAEVLSRDAAAYNY